jgi:hypothetical protein
MHLSSNKSRGKGVRGVGFEPTILLLRAAERGARHYATSPSPRE